MSTASEAPKNIDWPQPNQGVRTIVSMLLFVHLFGLAIAIATGSDYGGSDLLTGIKEQTPGLDSYLTQFWFHRGYDYHLMNDQPLDYQFVVEATVNYSDGRSSQPMTMPWPELGPGERQQRYKQLAWSVAHYVARAGEDAMPSPIDTDRKSTLSGAIGAGILRGKPDAESVAVRCLNHRLQTREEARSQDPNESNPNDPRYFSTFSNVMVKLDGDRPIIFEVLAASDVSPVRKPTESKPLGSHGTSVEGAGAKPAAGKGGRR